MNENVPSYFDRSAAGWDNEPRRIELMKAVGQAILDRARPTAEMDLLDYGCGTGLVGLFMLPHVRSVTGADSSPGMLDVLSKKIEEGGIERMRAVRLDLQIDPVPPERYHLVVSSMVTHHIAELDPVLTRLFAMLHPGGTACIADLDTEPGIFHPPEVADSVHHHGFDRTEFQQRMRRAGFIDLSQSTACVMKKPAADGTLRDFPIFLIIGRRPE